MTQVPAVRPVVPAAAAPSLAVANAAATALAAVSGGAVPASIAQLGVGALINGVVVERGPRGHAVIRTEQGTIALQTALALRVGASVALQIQTLGAQSQMLILSVDGRPLGQQNAAPPSSAPQNGKPPLAAGQEPIGAKARVPLEPLAKAHNPVQLADALGLRPGAILSGRLTPPTQAAAAPLPPSTALPTPQDGRVEVRVLGVLPPPSRAADGATRADMPMPRPAPGIALADDAVTFAATSLAPAANDPPGTTLLRTPFGLLRLPTPAAEPPGSRILLEMLSPRDPATARADRVAQEIGASRRMMSLSQEWPALRETFDALDKIAPPAVQQSALAAVPRVGPTLTAGLLLFIAAARAGNLRQWLGEPAIESLKRTGHGALIGRLADDMAALPRLAETQANGWQTLLVPVFDGDKLRHIRMSLRRGRQDGGERNDGARFIIEAEMSKLGPLQLDGFVRLPHFDLAVRTRENLPPDIRANIVEIFNDAMQAARLAGTVTFQTARDMRPGPFENWQTSGAGVTV
ncbi:MAG: hypothetical protein ACK4NA_01030 [Alphaproteobacteria bacterium]